MIVIHDITNNQQNGNGNGNKINNIDEKITIERQTKRNVNNRIVRTPNGVMQSVSWHKHTFMYLFAVVVCSGWKQEKFKPNTGSQLVH